MSEETTSPRAEPEAEKPEIIQVQQLENIEPVLSHDGIGLNIEEVRNLLMQKHDDVLGLDDPLLMLVTINNAFLGEYEKLLAKHNKAISAIMSAKTEGYIKTEELSSASVETIQKVFHEHALTLNNFSHNTKWMSAIIWLAALVNVGVFIFGAIK